MASVNVKHPWYKNKGPKGIEQSNNVAASDCVHKIPTKATIRQCDCCSCTQKPK